MTLKPTGEIVRKPLASLKKGSNIRSDLGDIKRLGTSMARRQRVPILIDDLDTIIDGYRRHAAAILMGIEWLDCLVVPAGSDPAEYRETQFDCAVHREGITGMDLAVALQEMVAAHPELTQKQIAEEIACMDAALFGKYLRIFSLRQEVQDAAKAGLIGVSDWYAIARSRNQLAALEKKLNGATRDKLEFERDLDEQPDDNAKDAQKGNAGTDASTPPQRVRKVKIPMATTAANGEVILAGKSGKELGWEDVEALLKEALVMVRAEMAKKKRMELKTVQANWRDAAKPMTPEERKEDATLENPSSAA